MKRSIIIDRAELINLAIEVSKAKELEHTTSTLSTLAKIYGRLLYEPTGMSAIHHTLYKSKDLSDRLFAIHGENQFVNTVKNNVEIDTIIKKLEGSDEVNYSIQLMERNSKSSKRSATEHLVYVFRLLSLARNHEADIFIWRHRWNLFETILKETKSTYKHVDLGNNLKALEISQLKIKIGNLNTAKRKLTVVAYHTLSSKDTNQKVIYFSYAWNSSNDDNTFIEKPVDELYNILELRGYKLIRDKMDLNYKGLISRFIQTLGKGHLIVVAISDKYIKSVYCMFELYEIYRNSKFDKNEFIKKILPIHVEQIRFNDPCVLKNYYKYWKDKEISWHDLIKNNLDLLGNEQFGEFQKVKQIARTFGDLISFIGDLNVLSPLLLSNSKYDEIIKAIESSEN